MPGKEPRIVCLGTSSGTELLSVGTEHGQVILLDMDNGLLITVRASGRKLYAVNFFLSRSKQVFS